MKLTIALLFISLTTNAQMYYRPLLGVNTDRAACLGAHVGYQFNENSSLKNAVVEFNAQVNILDSRHYAYAGLNIGYCINLSDTWSITPVAGGSLAKFTTDKNEFAKKDKFVFSGQAVATNSIWAFEIGLHGKVKSVGIGFNITRDKD